MSKLRYDIDWQPPPDDAYASGLLGAPATKADIVAAVAALRRDLERFKREMLLGVIVCLSGSLVAFYLVIAIH